MSVPQFVKSASARINRRIQGDVWYPIDQDGGDVPTWVRVDPVQFESTEAVQRFIAQLAVQTSLRGMGALSVRIHSGEASYEPPRPDPDTPDWATIEADCADFVSHISAAETRNKLSVHIREAEGEDPIRVELTGAGGQASPEAAVRVPGSKIDYGYLRALVDTCTTPISRADRRQRRALIEPVDLITAQQRRHDSDVSRRAAKIAGVLGFVTGVVGGGLSGPIVSHLLGW